MGAWEQTRTSPIGSQLLGGDLSQGWQILKTQSWAAAWQRREAGNHHIDEIGAKKGRLGKEEYYTKQDQSTEKPTFTLQKDAGYRFHVTKPTPKKTWNHGPCYIISPLTQMTCTPFSCYWH